MKEVYAKDEREEVRSMNYDLENNIAFKILQKRNSFEHVGNINRLVDRISPFLNQIYINFDNYTFHDVGHSKRVLDYMCQIAGENTLNQLTDLELAMMIYAAYLHDIGMWIEETEISRIKESPQFKFYLEKAKRNEKHALQEYVRERHGIRSYNFLKENENLKELFCTTTMLGGDCLEEVGLICQSHMEDLSWIDKNLKERFSVGEEYNSKYIALLLRIADYIDFDDKRAPEFFRAYKNLQEISLDEWKKHATVCNTEKVTNEKIHFDIKIKDFSLYCKLQNTLDKISAEINSCVLYSKKFCEEKYRLRINQELITNIEAEGFKPERFRFNLEYEAITRLLMGQNLYGDKAYGFREILQNSFDACNLMKEYYLKHDPTFNYSPSVSIVFDDDSNIVRIKDNGTGMSKEIIESFFFSIGKSYYKSDDFKKLGYEMYPTGTFGIGFLSSFMLSDNIAVTTKFYDGGEVSSFALEKQSPYICYKEEEFIGGHGTEIVFSKASFDTVLPKEEILKFIKENFYKLDADVLIYHKENGMIQEIAIAEGANFPEDLYGDISNYCNGIQCKASFGFVGSEFKVGNEFSEVCHEECVVVLLTNTEIVRVDKSEYHEFLGKKYTYLGTQYPFLQILSCFYEGRNIRTFEIEDYIDAFYKYGFDVFNQDIQFLDQDDYFLEEKNVELGEPVCIIWDDSIAMERIESVMKKARLDYLFDSEIITRNIFKEDSKFGYNVLYSLNTTVVEEVEYGQELIGHLNVGMRHVSEYNAEVYYRSVKIKDAKVIIPAVASVLENISVVVNILTDELEPSVNRTSLTKEQERILAYAVGKAVHLYALSLLPEEDEIKPILKSFIKNNYGDANRFCKK